MKPLSQTNLQQLAFIFAFIIVPLLCVVVMTGLSVAAGVCGVIVFILFLFEEKRLPDIDKSILLFLIGFLVLSATSALWSQEPSFVFERTCRLFANFAGGFLLLSSLKSFQDKRSLSALFLCALFPFIVMLVYLFIEYNYFQILYTSLKGIDQIYGTYVTPARLNWLMIAAVCFSWPLLCHLLFQKKKLMMLILLTLTLLISYQALSQSALLGIVCSFLVFCSTYVLSKKNVKRVFTAGILVILFGFPFFVSQIDKNIFHVDESKTIYELSPMEKLITTSSAFERVQIWAFTTKHIEKSPFIGHGIEAMRFIKTPKSHHIVKTKEWRSVSHPHNGVLQLWIEFGLLGVLFTSIFFIYLLNRISRLPDYSFKAATATLAALFIIGSVGYGLWQGWWISTLFLSAAYCTTLAKIERNDLRYNKT